MHSEYIDRRDGRYYVSGTRISLDSVVCAFNQGDSPERILEEFPFLDNLARVYGAIALYLDHKPDTITNPTLTSTSKTPVVSSRLAEFPWRRQIQSYGRKFNAPEPK